MTVAGRTTIRADLHPGQACRKPKLLTEGDVLEGE